MHAVVSLTALDTDRLRESGLSGVDVDLVFTPEREYFDRLDSAVGGLDAVAGDNRCADRHDVIRIRESIRQPVHTCTTIDSAEHLRSGPQVERIVAVTTGDVFDGRETDTRHRSGTGSEYIPLRVHIRSDQVIRPLATDERFNIIETAIAQIDRDPSRNARVIDDIRIVATIEGAAD